MGAPVITVDLNKNSSRKPRAGLIKKLSSTEKAVDLKKCETATANRASLLQKKKEVAANQSKKVQEAAHKAVTHADEIRKVMLAKTTCAAAKAESNRNAIMQAKINKAAIVTRKLREAKSKACTEKAKAAKEKAEKQAASAAIINIPTGLSPARKMKKDLIDRLSPERLSRRHSRIDADLAKAASLRDELNKIKVTKAAAQSTPIKSSRVNTVTFDTQAKLDKAEINRIAVNQLKAQKASQVSTKAQAALENANTSKAKAAKSKAQLRAGEIQIINVPVVKNIKKQPSPSLMARLTNTTRPLPSYLQQRKNRAEEQRQRIVDAKIQKAAKVLDEVDGVVARNRMRKEDMQIALRQKLQKAECNHITAREEVIFKGAVESRKVLKAAIKAQTDAAKAVKAKAEARAGTEKIINVEINKSPKKVDPSLLCRLSLSSAYTSEFFQNQQQQASKNREKATDLKKNKASKVIERNLATLARQLKTKEDMKMAITNKFDKAENKKKSITEMKQLKAAKESEKVEIAKVKANSDEAKAAKAKAESRPGECHIINVAVAKNQKIKPNKALVSRLLKK